MRRLLLLTLAAAFVIGATYEANAGLFDCFRSKSNCCEPAPSCCAPEPVCCAPAPEPACCAPAPTCCAPAPTCCAPAPTCCGSAPMNGVKKPYEETPPLPKKAAPKGDIKPAPKKK